MKKMVTYIVFAFLSGYFVANILSPKFGFQPAKAEVAGMNSYDLKYDYDFKRAVEMIVEDNCEIVNFGQGLELECR